MKIKDLIKELEKFDPELEVCCVDGDEWFGPIVRVEYEDILEKPYVTFYNDGEELR